jgi:hypothetical protein
MLGRIINVLFMTLKVPLFPYDAFKTGTHVESMG